MKAVVQRVVKASVSVDNALKGSINRGLLVYLGVAHDDSTDDANWLAEKIINLRILDDEEGKMNLSLIDIISRERTEAKADISGVLTVSQFTLLGDVRKGRRPSWAKAASPEKAKELYEYFIEKIKKQDIICESGEFQASMMVNYTNDGPVTILLDSKEITG